MLVALPVQSPASTQILSIVRSHVWKVAMLTAPQVPKTLTGHTALTNAQYSYQYRTDIIGYIDI